MRRLSVIGGSSPFTAALVDSLAARYPSVARCHLVLQGRNLERLTLLRDYAEHRLGSSGFKAEATTNRVEALTGADVILHQPRYGGLELRAQGEELCARHEVPADETLGPAALLSALRTRAAVDDFVQATRRHAPEAWVLNLTNPLSLVTARIAEAGLRCVGLCELPVVTLERVASMLEVPSSSIAWQYAGLNHRGFLFDLRRDGSDLLGELTSRLGGMHFEGIGSATIERLKAVPLKYFRLVEDQPGAPVRRARELSVLRKRIVAELAERGSSSPPSLARRYLEWYPRAVLPMLEAIDSEQPTVQVVNVQQGDGIVREVKARIASDGVDQLVACRVPPEVKRWVRIFERHEAAVLAAVAQPTTERVERVLELDPTVPGGRISRLAVELLREESMEPTP